jgi:rubredoxin
MTIQNIQRPDDLRCPHCGNKTRFRNFTQEDNCYLHFQCEVCYEEITGWKDKSLRDEAAAYDTEDLPP